MPKINAFVIQIDELNMNNENIRDAMIKLDGSMGLKLDKSALIQLEEDFCEKFVTHEYRRGLDIEMEGMVKRFEKHQNRFNEEVKDYTDKIGAIVTETMES